VPGLLRWFFASHPRRSPWRCPVASTNDGGLWFIHGVIRTRKNRWFKNYELNESIKKEPLLSAEFYTIHTHLYTNIYSKLQIPSPLQGICWRSTQTRLGRRRWAQPVLGFLFLLLSPRVEQGSIKTYQRREADSLDSPQNKFI
jgi:hypothetical protein